MYITNKLINKENLLQLLILLVAAFFLLFWALGYRSLWSSEGRWAEITREMFISGDFFHPTIGGEPYFDKPLITYWIIAALSAITGRLDEFITRLPSAIAAIIVIICTIQLGKRLWSFKVGLLAGGLLLTSYGLLKYSHIASAETENLAAVMLAITWYWARRERPGFVSFLVFYLIIFIGSHMKGLTAFVVPVLAVLPDILRQQRWRWLLRPSHLLALAIGIVVYFAPFVHATLSQPESYQQNGLALVFQENILRYFKPIDHKGPIYLYLYAVPLLILPWIPIFVGALITSATNWKKLNDKTSWLIQAIAVIFAFFTLSGSRRNYYILPILPFCMLLIAVFLAEFTPEIVGKHRDRGLKIQKLVLLVVGVTEAVFGPLIVWFLINKKGWDLPSLLGWSCLIIGLGIILMGILADRIIGTILQDSQSGAAWASIIMAGIFLGGFFAWQFNILEANRTERPFAFKMKAVAENVSHERVAFYRKPEDRVLFYMKLDLPVTILKNEKELSDFLEEDESGLLISQEKNITEVAAAMLPLQPDYKETTYKWESPEKKLKAWIINQDNMLIGMEANNAN